MSLTDFEIPGTWVIRQERNGITGVKQYIIPRADYLDLTLPTPGSQWPGPEVADFPNLLCVGAEWAETEDPAYVRITYQFSTDGEIVDDFSEISASCGTMQRDSLFGWHWESTGTVVVNDIPREIVVMQYQMRCRTTNSTITALSGAINCVNDRTFRGFAAGHMLLRDAELQESYTAGGVILSANTVYTFEVIDPGGSITHNHFYRPPVQDRDGNGNPLWYQDKDAAKDGYTTDDTLIGTPVMVSGAAGTGGDDRPLSPSGDTYRAAVDFATVLSLPKIAGDG